MFGKAGSKPAPKASAVTDLAAKEVSEVDKKREEKDKAPERVENNSPSADEHHVVRFGEFLSPGASVWCTSQKYAWIDQPLTDKSQLASILEAWDLGPPNLVIALVGGAGPHPARFVSSAMLENQDELKPLVDSANKALQQTTGQELQASTEGAVGNKLLKALGMKLFENVIEILTGLLTACAQTQSWILVGTSGSFADGPHTYLLEEALTRSTVRPQILCFACDLSERNSNILTGKEYKGDKETGAKIALAIVEGMRQLRTAARPPGSAGQAGHHHVEQISSDVFGGHTSLHAMWDPDACEGAAEDMRVASTFAWWPFRGASHYIFRDSEHENVNPFPLHWLGDQGCLFMAGYDAVSFAIDSCIKWGQPTVILRNTGLSCDFFGLAIEAIVKSPPDQRPKTEDEVLARIQERQPFWFANGSDVGEGQLFGVDYLQDWAFALAGNLLKRPVEQLNSSVVVLNAWVDSPGVVLRRLSQCFAASSDISLELGAETVEEDVVVAAWEQQAVLEHNAEIMLRQGNFLYITGSLLSFFATALSVCTTYAAMKESWGKQLLEDGTASSAWVDAFLIALPAFSGLILTFSSKFRFVPKWAALHGTAKVVESEIFKFRTKAGYYEQTQTVLVSKPKKKGRPENPREDNALRAPQKSPKKRARDLFVANVSMIFGSAVAGEMQQDALAQPKDMLRSFKKKQNQATVQMEHKVAVRASPGPLTMQQEQRESLLRDGFDETASPFADLNDGSKHLPQHESGDDHISPLSTEDYVEYRLKPQLVFFQTLAPRLAMKLKVYEFLMFAASLLASLMSPLGLKELIPMAVSITALISTFLQFENLQSHLSSVNAGIRDMTALCVQWRSFSVMEKRSRFVKRFIVSVTEAAILGEVTAYAGSTSAASTKFNKDRDDKEEGEGESEDKEKQHR